MFAIRFEKFEVHFAPATVSGLIGRSPGQSSSTLCDLSDMVQNSSVGTLSPKVLRLGAGALGKDQHTHNKA